MRLAGKQKKRKILAAAFLIQLMVIAVWIGNHQKVMALQIREQIIEDSCNMLLSCYAPGLGAASPDSLTMAALPAVRLRDRTVCSGREISFDYQALVIAENEQASKGEKESVSGQSQQESQREAADSQNWIKPEEDGTSNAVETVSAAGDNKKKNGSQVQINRKKLTDYDYLRQSFYQVDSSTTITKAQLNVKDLLGKDVSVKKNDKEGPQILIYHTHSQEGYKDSEEGDVSTGVVGVGDLLTEILEKKYGYRVLHHKGQYDVGDRQHAYANAEPEIEKILKKNPSIEVVIDLHRDGVGEKTRLVTKQNGKKMAQIMFFNGLCRTTAIGDIEWLPNPYIADNLALSFQMQLTAAEKYPGLTRKIYLKGYRYNMHFCPRSILVEVGAQTNTVKEAKNAMEPLAEILDQVLSGKNKKK